MKLTFGDIKANIAKILSMASTDSRVLGYVNEAQERLMYKGSWPGTYVRYAIKNSNGLITWPRQLETIESVIVKETPGVIRNEWFEFLESGPGLLDKDDGDALTLLDRGESVTFSDIGGLDSTLKVYTTIAADAGADVLFQGYDEDGDWIRTLYDGNYVDGEYVTLASTPVTTTSKFTVVVGVQKPVTLGNVKVYEYIASDESERLIANYQPTEQRPVYRRSLIPGIPDDNTTRNVTVVGKLRFLPTVNDTDWLYIGYESAIKEMVMSIRKAEMNLPQEASIYERRAVKLLEEQLMHYLGDGAVAVPKFQNMKTFGGGGVASVI